MNYLRKALFILAMTAGCYAAEVPPNKSDEMKKQPQAVDQGTDGNTQNREYMWLSTDGKDIVYSKESKGGMRPFIPTGVGYCRDVIIRNDDEGVMKFAKENHLNTIRLCIYTRFFNNQIKNPIDIQKHIREFIDPVIEQAKKYNLYVILDDHQYFSEKIDEDLARQSQDVKSWDEAGVQKWIDGWKAIAERYQDEPIVLGYELCNEPHDISPKQCREWYTRCLKEIRKIDTRHIVLLGNSDWSHARSMEPTWGDFAATVDQPYNRVVFTFHDYPNDNNPWVVEEHIRNFRSKHNVPVMCTEFGATWWGWSETACREFQAGMMVVFARENVGWMIWALARLKHNPRVPHPDYRREGETKEAYNARIKEFKADKNNSDSCAYSDIWVPAARIMGSKFPEPAQ